MQDYYETLQVHPRADQEAIEASYTRLSQLYDPARVEGAADELVELARQKRQVIEQAYAVLRDPQARASYDTRQAATVAHGNGAGEAAANAAASSAGGRPVALDYRPLPPARGHERDKRAAIRPTPLPLPTQSGRRVSKTRPLWLVPTIIASTLTLTVTVVSLALTSGVRTAPPSPTPAAAVDSAAAPDTAAQQGSQQQSQEPQQLLPLSEIVAEYDKQAATARQAAQQQQTSDAWVQYGNALYDSVMVVREREPAGQLYQDRLPLWIEATKAYSRALEIDPNNVFARADLAMSYCYYGGDTGDQVVVRQGTAQAQQAQQQAPKEPRVLLGLGICLTQEEPPATGEALTAWQQIVQGQPDSPEAAQAKLLIERYRPR